MKNIVENLVKNYLKKYEMKQTEFAMRVGISKQLLNWHLKHPEAKWNPQVALGIETATNCEILAYDLVFRDRRHEKPRR